VLSSSSLGPEQVSSFDPGVFKASLSGQLASSLLSARVRKDGISLVVNKENSEQALGPPLASTGNGGLQELVCFDGAPSESSRGVNAETWEMDFNTHEMPYVDKGWDKSRRGVLDWPLISSKKCSRVADLLEPLAVDFSCLQNNSGSLSEEDVWDGRNLNKELVFKWVASKLKSIAGCLRVAFSGYELEVIQLLSRIEKSFTPSKPVVQRTPPTSKRYRELRRLEFEVNYDRPSNSSCGMKMVNG